MRMGQHPDKSRLVLEMTGSLDFQANVVDMPKSLMIHLPLRQWSVSGDTVFAQPFKSVQHITVDDDFIRLTFPLSSPHIIQSAFMIQGQADTPHRLVIDMVPSNDIEFARALNQTYGTLPFVSSPKTSMDTLIGTIIGDNTSSSIRPFPKPPLPQKAKKPIIVIDAGHGGKDPGAISPKGIFEKNITLSMSKTVAAYLNQTGRYDARLTRSDDRFIKLHNRVRIARNAGADIFISIHADSVRNDNTRGASVYTLSDVASDKQTARLAARENQADLIGGIDLNIEDEDVSKILIDLSMRETMNQSKTLANTVIDHLRTGGVRTLKGPHRYAGFAVLKAPDVPSVLIETGFVSNEGEARRLLQPDYQRLIAKSLTEGLDKYFGFK